MRRIVVTATALAIVLGAAVSAYAATGGLNSYGAKLAFSPSRAGTAKAPVAVGFSQKYTAASSTSGNRTAPLTDIKTKVYGLVTNGKAFPKCTLAQIAAAKSDTACPKGALVATGSITALIGPVNDQSKTASSVVPCNPTLDVWNGGQGKVVFFFVDKAPAHLCANGAIPTGFVGPFQGTTRIVGKNLILDTPIPSFVSFPISGAEGSLTGETLHWKKLSAKVHGKTVAYNASVACKGGKRPYSVTFTAESGPGGAKSSSTVSGTQACRK